MKIILYQPQIPQNTGNVVRTCSVTGTDLILVTPLGFEISDRWLKRAGLDYWEGVLVETIDSLETYLKDKNSFYFFSSHAKQSYLDVDYQENSLLIFGSETSGLPDYFHQTYPDKFIKIPMLPNKRCLNLATSVGIGLFGALELATKKASFQSA